MGDQMKIIALIDIDILLPVKRCLERCDHGFKVEQVSDIGAFRRLIVSKEFDCILSSVESPSVGDVMGFQLKRHPPIPVVLLSHSVLALDSSENYERIAGRIRRRVESSKRQGGTQGSSAVIRRGTEIYVRDVNGKYVFWGCEDMFSGVASEMELELRAIDYVRDRLAETVSEITEEFSLSGLAPEHVSDIVYEGYTKLLLRFRDLDVSLGHRKGS